MQASRIQQRRNYALAALLFFIYQPVQAHFQLLYTAETTPTRGVATDWFMLFTHPAHGGPHMDMAAPEKFYLVSQRGDAAEPQVQDLLEYVEPLEFSSEQGITQAYSASLPRSVTRSLGDYVFVLQPAPYFESTEDKYIQQFTRTMVNVGGVPGNWAEPMGLPAEILPLNKPYANWQGGVFRGVVLADGGPVPNAEIEIEYLNHDPNLENMTLGEQAKVELPQDSFGTQTIYANAAGEFTIGLPRAGWWGICALAIGADTEHEGKELSQDGVLWLQVKDLQ